MQNKNSLLLILISLLLSASILPSCDEVEDVRGVAALRNVDFTFDSLSMDMILPEGALSGGSFEDLLNEDPDLYGNPASYGIDFTGYYFADNTSSDAGDAKFDGMLQNIVINNISGNPVSLSTPAFDIDRNQTITILTQGGLNLETHRAPGLYIFEQTVEGLPISSSFITELLYQIGSEEGSIMLPEIQYDIPTRASDEMKAFLSGLIASGIFDEPKHTINIDKRADDHHLYGSR